MPVTVLTGREGALAVVARRIAERVKDGSWDVFDEIDHALVLDSALQFVPATAETDRHHLIRAGLAECGRKASFTADAILCEIDSAHRAFAAQRARRLVFATSLSMRRPTKPIHVRVAGTKIVVDARHPDAILRARRQMDSPTIDTSDVAPSGHAAARVYLRARSNGEAAQRSIDALDCLRGMWKFRH